MERSSSRIWERLYDPKLYTGCHKHRFDLGTGKGLGKLGRTGGTHLRRAGPLRLAAPPRMLVCYLCGTMHGVCSLVHHIPPCAERRARSNMPDASAPPQVPMPGPNATRAEVDAYNEAAQAAYESAMPYCRVCTRTFSTVEKLRAHEKCCIVIGEKSFYPRRGESIRRRPMSPRPISPSRAAGAPPPLP